MWQLIRFVGLILLANRGVADLRMFFNLTQVLEFFSNDSSLLSRNILYTFENECRIREQKVIPRDRRPFIVIEGNHRKSRNVIGMRVARLMNGRYLVHPAPCLQKFANQLPRGTLFRRSFYLLSTYALSFEVKFHLVLGRSVVVNGYWWDMLTFALVQAFPPEDIPEPEDPIFHLPRDLFQPDLVFFLHFPDNVFYNQSRTRIPSTWKPRVLKMYRGLQKRGESVSVQTLSGVFRPTIDAIYETVLRNLSCTRDVWFEDPERVNFDYDQPGKSHI